MTEPIKSGQYPEYQIGGQPFTRINPDVNPAWENVATRVLQYLAPIMHSIIPTKQGDIYNQAVIQRRTQPFTEKDFSSEDLQGLARAVVRSQASGQSTLQYPHYGRYDGPWANILGRASYSITPKGDVDVRDLYKFNNYEVDPEKGDESGRGADANFNVFLKPEAWLGRRALPAGLRGTPVNIHLPAGMLENALSTIGGMPE